MPYFQYKALNSGGVLDAGSIQASSRPDAFDKIKQLGLQLVQLEETAEGGADLAKSDGISLPWKQRRISFKMLGTFTRLLSSLLAAGVPLSKALTILYRETADPAASKKWRDRKSTRLNSSHALTSYAVFCLKKKNTTFSPALIFF